MRQNAELEDKASRLEHVVAQLEGETETIGDYITLYHAQRKSLKTRSEEKDAQIVALVREKQFMQERVNELQRLILTSPRLAAAVEEEEEQKVKGNGVVVEEEELQQQQQQQMLQGSNVISSDSTVNPVLTPVIDQDVFAMAPQQEEAVSPIVNGTTSASLSSPDTSEASTSEPEPPHAKPAVASDTENNDGKVVTNGFSTSQVLDDLNEFMSGEIFEKTSASLDDDADAGTIPVSARNGHHHHDHHHHSPSPALSNHATPRHSHSHVSPRQFSPHDHAGFHNPGVSPPKKESELARIRQILSEMAGAVGNEADNFTNLEFYPCKCCHGRLMNV